MDMRKRGRILAALCLFLLCFPPFLQAVSPNREEGEKLFLDNKPGEARPLLEAALNEEPGNERLYLYLATCWDLLGDPNRAITILRRGLEFALEYKDLFYYNMGNDYLRIEEYTVAEEMFTSAVTANRKLSEGYLNRGNVRLRLSDFQGALTDYELYLQMKPNAAQAEPVQKVTDLLRAMLAAAETKRKLEAEKQKALLSEVLNSLSNASEDAKNASVESIRIKEDSEEIDIKD
jgi:tetratricopeptide (TPR) repeat protein